MKVKSRMVVARGWKGGENRGLYVKGYKVFIIQNE